MRTYKEIINEHYVAEKKSALSLIGIAILMMVIAGIIYLTVKAGVTYGIIYGLLPLSIIQILAGIFVFIKANLRQKIIIKKIEGQPNFKIETELKRTSAEVKRLRVTRKIQETAFVIALFVICLGMAKLVNPIGMGLAMALLLQAGVMIAFDLFAVRRAEEYLRRINKLASKN